MWRELRADVELDLQALRRELDETVEHRAAMMARPPANPPDGWDKRAAAGLMHQCYNGMENALKRIALSVDGSTPGGAASHAELLQQVSKPGNRRSAVISEELYADLRELMGFRHVARGHYGHEYEWDRMRPLLERLPGIADRFIKDVRQSLSDLESGSGKGPVKP